jgi:hypothetical protein
VVAPTLLRLRWSALNRAAERAHGLIDDLNGTGGPYADAAARPAAIAQGAPIYIAGWIYAGSDGAGLPEVAITIDGEFAAFATCGLPRPDVAALHGRDAIRCGFEAVLPSSTLEPGIRQFAAVQLLDAMTYRVGPERPVTISRSVLSFDIATPARAGIHVQVDAFIDGPLPADTSRGLPSYGPESTVSVVGWAADLNANQPSAAVYAVVDNVHYFRGRYGIERRDVAERLGSPQLRCSGYEIRIDGALLGPGDHLIAVLALSADGEHRSEPSLPRAFEIRLDRSSQ